MWISDYTDSKDIVTLVTGSKTCDEVCKRLESYGLEKIPFVEGNYYVNTKYYIEVYYFDAMHQVSVTLKLNKSGRTAKEFSDLDAFNRKLSNMSLMDMQYYEEGD
jgi:hypothetical protein